MTSALVVAPYQSVFEVPLARFLKFSTPPTSRGPPHQDPAILFLRSSRRGSHALGTPQRQNHEGMAPASGKLPDPPPTSRGPPLPESWDSVFEIPLAGFRKSSTPPTRFTPPTTILEVIVRNYVVTELRDYVVA